MLELSIKYDNVLIPNFIKITNVKTQVLPNIENKFLQAPRSIGAIDVGTNYGTKVITISFIFKDNSLGFIEKSEALALGGIRLHGSYENLWQDFSDVTFPFFVQRMSKSFRCVPKRQYAQERAIFFLNSIQVLLFANLLYYTALFY